MCRSAAYTLDDGRTYLPPEQRSIGYVPQEGALFPNLSVQQNVGFGLPRRERRGQQVTALLEMVGIAPLAKRLPHELSGGEQQRVALARALARRPQALLLDEPFSSLDASLRTRVREEVHTLLREQGVTTVLVTHDQEEALSFADTVAVLRDGRIIQHGEPAELYERPADERLARFLGAVNVLAAKFEHGVALTTLGELQLREQPQASDAAAGVVMIRPEQLEVRVRADGSDHGLAPNGLGGRVERCRYYGHDALLHIRPDQPAGARQSQDADPVPDSEQVQCSQLLLARVHGEQTLPIGTRVTLAAHGPATPLR